MDLHSHNYHSEVTHTLTQLRRKYWLTKRPSNFTELSIICAWSAGNRTTISTTLYAIISKKQGQSNKNLPEIGVDYLDPVTIKRDIQSSKWRIALFTYFNTRAVHLEVVNYLADKNFINCLRRHITRRGCPEEILSESATQFLLPKVVIDQAWSNMLIDPKILNYIRTQKILCHTVTPWAPWKEETYEQLVGLTKLALRNTIGWQLRHYTAINLHYRNRGHPECKTTDLS